MAIVQTIENIKQNISDAYGIAEEKGATIPENKNLENLSDTIGSITGGGGDLDEYFNSIVNTTGQLNNTGRWATLVKKLMPFEFTQANGNYLFGSFKGEHIPKVTFDTDLTSTDYMFYNCDNLKEIQLFDTSKVKTAQYMFYSCSSLLNMPVFDFSSCNNLSNTFYSCISLTSITMSNTSNVTNFNSTFSACRNVTNISNLDTSSATSISSMFRDCAKMEYPPQIDTSNVTSMSALFYGCNNLKEVPELDCSKATQVSNMFNQCSKIIKVGGFKNLGKAYLTSTASGVTAYTLQISSPTLEETELIKIFNSVYDIASLGCKTQKLIVGSTNLAQLKSTEGQQALANAQAKGWSIS